MADGRLRVGCINVWGLPDIITGASLIVPNKVNLTKVSRKKRIERIANRLGDFDVICMQEVWLASDRKFLIQQGRKQGLIYWRQFPCGRLFQSIANLLRLNEKVGDHQQVDESASSPFGIGSGIMILSRYQIVYSDFQPFSLIGKPLKVYHGDYQSSRGIAMITIKYGELSQLIDIYSAHTVAQYSLNEKDEYRAHRMTNIIEYINFVNKHKSSRQLVITTGDFNENLNATEIAYFVQQLKLTDCFFEKNGVHDVVTHMQDNKRLDFIMYKSYPVKDLEWALDDCFLCLLHEDIEHERSASRVEENLPSVFYSDHIGVFAEFTYQKSSDKKNSNVTQMNLPHSNLDKSVIKILADGCTRAKRQRTIELVIALMLIALIWCTHPWLFIVIPLSILTLIHCLNFIFFKVPEVKTLVKFHHEHSLKE